MPANPTEAIADFQQAIQYDANYAVAYLALASVFNSTGRFDEALPVLGQAERLAPNAWQIYFEFARANIGKGNFAEALHNIDRASELQGGAAEGISGAASGPWICLDRPQRDAASQP